MTAKPAPTLAKQVEQQLLEVQKQRGWIDALRAQVQKRRRPEHDLNIALAQLPIMEAILETLRHLQKHEAHWRGLLKKQPIATAVDLLGAG